MDAGLTATALGLSAGTTKHPDGRIVAYSLSKSAVLQLKRAGLVVGVITAGIRVRIDRGIIPHTLTERGRGMARIRWVVPGGAAGLTPVNTARATAAVAGARGLALLRPVLGRGESSRNGDDETKHCLMFQPWIVLENYHKNSILECDFQKRKLTMCDKIYEFSIWISGVE